jgi:hypothetical protein
MPIITTLETSRFSGSRPSPGLSWVLAADCVGSQSPSWSRATMTCAAISAAVRLRTSRCVPVWQNEQLSVQPTWLEMHSVPRSVSGM